MNQNRSQKQIDCDFMSYALELAHKGLGMTSPNPSVGAVIVKNGEIVGSGYHHRAGSAHAEIVALKSAGARASGATMYVTLEPCCHRGRTGPCVEAIITSKVARVCYSNNDPNPQVNGRGARRLRSAGIAITRGILQRESKSLNDVYFSRHSAQNNGRPFVILKTAQTLDGRIASVTGNSRWISGEKSLVYAHRLRGEVDAVIIGSGTALQDDPELTVRRIKGRNPYRIVVSASGKVNPKLKLFSANKDRKTILATANTRLSPQLRNSRGLIVWDIQKNKHSGKRSGRLSDRNAGELSLTDLLEKAKGFGITSILVEGGSKLATNFLKAGLVDKHIIVIAPLTLGDGVPSIGNLGAKSIADAITYSEAAFTQLGADMVFTGYPENREQRTENRDTSVS